MEAIGSEVGIKMRSAIKAKLMELGCYVDDELPDYVMVMVANKRTRSQMEEDLQLFLSANTEAFVCWLHQVLQKLQEVTINTKLVIPAEISKKGKRSPGPGKKDHKDKERRKSRDRSKNRDKPKKSKKDKSKKSDTETIRPNIPRLLMNLEKESSPSITDIFAGQILKSHGILTNSTIFPSETAEKKDTITCNLEDRTKRKLVRNRFQIIDPATVTQINPDVVSNPISVESINSFNIPLAREIRINEPMIELMNIKTKNKQIDEVDSDGDDFINLGTEAEDLIGVGLVDDISIKNKEKFRAYTPPIILNKSPIRQPIKSPEDVLPQIELNLPKRPLRERLGVREDSNKRTNYSSNSQPMSKVTVANSFHMDEETMFKRISSRINFERTNLKSIINDKHDKSSIKNRLLPREKNDDNKNNKFPTKRISSRIVSVQQELSKGNSTPMTVASVVRAPPRPTNVLGISAAPQLLLRAMADAQKSILNMPPKIDIDRNLKKKGISLPIRRNIKPQKIIIEVPTNKIPSGKFENHDSNSDFEIDMDTESLGEFENDRDAVQLGKNTEYVPESLPNKSDNFKGAAYIPTHIHSNNKKIETVAEPTILKDSNVNGSNVPRKNPQFVVTLDGLDPNVFLEKKLEIINQESENEKKPSNESSDENKPTTEDNKTDSSKIDDDKNNIEIKSGNDLNNSSDLNAKIEDSINNSPSKKIISIESRINQPLKRKASPIVFSKDDKLVKTSIKIDSKDRAKNKYDSLPSLPIDKRTQSREHCRFFPDCRLGAACEFYHPPAGNAIIKQNTICRTFPACTFGDNCVYIHPQCKFNTACVRKDCLYSHSEKTKIKSSQSALSTPSIASHVVPASNYKTVSPLPLPSICKYHPNCSNSGCHWYHPKPCRFGKFCLNKVECNFYHHNIPSLKWKSSHKE